MLRNLISECQKATNADYKKKANPCFMWLTLKIFLSAPLLFPFQESLSQEWKAFSQDKNALVAQNDESVQPQADNAIDRTAEDNVQFGDSEFEPSGGLESSEINPVWNWFKPGLSTLEREKNPYSLGVGVVFVPEPLGVFELGWVGTDYLTSLFVFEFSRFVSPKYKELYIFSQRLRTGFLGKIFLGNSLNLTTGLCWDYLSQTYTERESGLQKNGRVSFIQSKLHLQLGVGQSWNFENHMGFSLHYVTLAIPILSTPQYKNVHQSFNFDKNLVTATRHFYLSRQGPLLGIIRTSVSLNF